jgi:hypothetical protein
MIFAPSKEYRRIIYPPERLIKMIVHPADPAKWGFGFHRCLQMI